MDGAIVKSLVKGNGRDFLKRIVWWMLIAVPATFTNSMVGFGEATATTGYQFANRLSPVVLPPSRALFDVSNTFDAVYSRQVPLTADFLRTVGS